MSLQSISINVRGYHLDVYKHVNNARYLEFLEEARWAIYDDAIQTLFENHLSFGIASIHINYRAPALLGNTLLIDAHVTRLGDKSFTITQKIMRQEDQTLIADADVICVIIDNKTGKSVFIQDGLLTLLAKGAQLA